MTSGSSSSHFSLRSALSYYFRDGVFLMFSEEDTGDGFTSHLSKALRQAKPLPLRIECSAEKIEKTKIAVVVFSENFASSEECLDSLVKILEFKKTKIKYRVLPVFYKVDPSELRHCTGKTGKYLQELEGKYESHSAKVRDAIASLSNLVGWHYTDGVELSLIQKITEYVSNKLVGGQKKS